MELSAPDLFTGTQVNYYFICKTKLWLFSHRITMEQSSDLIGPLRAFSSPHGTAGMRPASVISINSK